MALIRKEEKCRGQMGEVKKDRTTREEGAGHQVSSRFYHHTLSTNIFTLKLARKHLFPSKNTVWNWLCLHIESGAGEWLFSVLLPLTAAILGTKIRPMRQAATCKPSLLTGFHGIGSAGRCVSPACG